MRATVILRRLRIPLRIALWALPIVWMLVLLLGIREQLEHATLDQARTLLLDGEGASARELLAELRSSPWTGEQARAGLELADALVNEVLVSEALSEVPLSEVPSEVPAASETANGDLERSLDPSAFAVPLIIRTAFERGDFQAALRLTELAERLGMRTVPLVTAAASIEADRVQDAQRLTALDRTPPGNMLRRVAHHLGSPEEQGGVLLRDRSGRPIGTADTGNLDLMDHVRPELVPRAVSDVLSEHPTTGSLRLTLDLELSEAAYKAFGRYRGSIVLVEPQTGEILAAVSDRRTWRKGGTPAFEQLREPASIAKLITATAAWRAGIDPDAALAKMRCRGHESYSGKLLYCPSIVGRLRGLDRALATSCNVAFANLGVQVGREGMIDEFRRYGFDRFEGLLGSSRIVQPYGDDRQLADLSIGLEASAITPLHAALLAAVVAADGVMPVPTIVAAEDGRLGLHPRPLPIQPGQRVIDSRWVPELTEAMEAVVRRGTAQRVWPPGNFPVAMKTGTASDPRYGFHVNYIGIGPMPDARLAFCVRITDQPTSVKVRYAARQVTHRLLRSLGRIAEDRGWSNGGVDLLRERYPSGRLAAADRDGRRSAEVRSGRTSRSRAASTR